MTEKKQLSSKKEEEPKPDPRLQPPSYLELAAKVAQLEQHNAKLKAQLAIEAQPKQPALERQLEAMQATVEHAVKTVHSTKAFIAEGTKAALQAERDREEARNRAKQAQIEEAKKTTKLVHLRDTQKTAATMWAVLATILGLSGMVAVVGCFAQTYFAAGLLVAMVTTIITIVFTVFANSARVSSNRYATEVQDRINKNSSSHH